MAVAFDVLPEKRLILTACVGQVSFREIMSCVLDCRSDPRYRREYAGICDVREGTFTLGVDEVRSMAEQIGAGADRSAGKWAFLIDEPKSTALVMVFGSARDPATPVRVFVTLPAACEWLDADATESELSTLRRRACGDSLGE